MTNCALLSVVTTILLVTHYSKGYSKTCERLGIHFYELLGCSIEATQNGCPIKYDCPKYKIADEKTCMIGGKEVQHEERMRHGTVPCLMCRCNGPPNMDDVHQFPCAMPKCRVPDADDGCYLKKDFNTCCPQEIYCPDSSSEICQVHGKNYTEHQMFEPEGTCLQCICQKDFKPNEQPYCQRIPCNLEVKYFKYLENDCTPFYRNAKALCCPEGYICGDAVTKVSVKRITSPSSGVVCSFKGKTYPSNSKFDVKFSYKNEDYTAKCECKVAPHPTCIVF